MLLSRLDLPLTIAFVLFHLQFNVFCSKSTSETLSSSTLFSDVIDKKVSILVDPIRVIIERSTNADHDDQLQQNRTFAVDKIQWPPPSTSNTSAALCALSLHRNANCDGPTIGPSERIGWDTRICFRWSCDGAAGTGMAMRVENCWTGSEHSPIELIDHLGCSRRETMISTPVHRHVQRMAKSAGWLTVRLFNTNHIRLSCAIRLCHACDDKCRTKIHIVAQRKGRREGEMEDGIGADMHGRKDQNTIGGDVGKQCGGKRIDRETTVADQQNGGHVAVDDHQLGTFKQTLGKGVNRWRVNVNGKVGRRKKPCKYKKTI